MKPHIPTLNIHKLYGRELDIRGILSAFDRVRRGGATEAVFVSGQPGIGKTALIHEIRRSLTAQNSYFIEGKYDQLKQDVPYSAVIQAFKGLVEQLLLESEDRLCSQREQIQNAVGSNGRIITDVIPDIERIIGCQPEVAPADPLESQNRFNRVMQKFVRVFAEKERPLVLFLDDLQWIDLASLNLLNILIRDPESKDLLIMGAYRDTEVGSTHPFMHLVDDLTKAGVPITATSLPPLQLGHVNKLIADLIIEASQGAVADLPHPLRHMLSELTNAGAPVTATTLTPLDIKDVNTLIADALTCPREQSDALAGIVYQRTHGNPFFIIQILNVFCEKGLLTYEPTQGWQWRLEDINRLSATDSIVDLLVAKITRLAPGTQAVLKLASCIGSRFDLETLSSVYDQSLAKTFVDLSQAIQEQLIIPSNEAYAFFHDRIQEAAYSLLTENEKKQVHRKIGYLVLGRTTPENRAQKIFYIADQLNLGSELIARPEKKIELAELNLLAGKKAKASTAFASAAKYLSKGIDLLPEDRWRTHYALALALHMECSENLYLSGDFEGAEKLFSIILQNAKTNREKAEVYNMLVLLSQNRGKPLDAIWYGRRGLKLLGLNLPLKPSKLAILIELLKIKWHISDRTAAELVCIPQVADLDGKVVSDILTSIAPAAYYYDKKLASMVALNMFMISQKHAQTLFTPLGYAMYGFISCAVSEEYGAGYEFGVMSMKLCDQNQSLSIKAQCNFVFSGFVNHWRRPLKTSIDYLVVGYVCGLESGNFVYAGYCAGVHTVTKVFKGDQLDDVQEQSEKYLEVFKRLQIKDMFLAITAVHRMVLCLKGLTKGPSHFSDNDFDEADLVKQLRGEGLQFIFCLYHIFKLPLFYLFDEYAGALETSEELQKKRDHLLGMYYVVHHNFYYSLTLTALYPSSSLSEKFLYWRRLKKNQKKMKQWVNNCPENFLNKYTLVAAEMARVRGKHAEAEGLYDQAIALSRENEFIQEQAIANELAGKFYLSRGNEQRAHAYLQEARSCYQKWGAVAKVKHLEKTYPHLLSVNGQKDY